MRYFFYILFIASMAFGKSVSYKSLHQVPEFVTKEVGFKNQVLHASSSHYGGRYEMVISYTDRTYRGEHTICLEDSKVKCMHEPNPHKKRWCAPKWYRYRVYLPKGSEIRWRLSATRNATYVALYYFVPDGSQPKTVDLNNFKAAYYEMFWGDPYYYTDFPDQKSSDAYLFEGYNVLFKKEQVEIQTYMVFERVPKSGWLYINYIQAGGHTEPSYQGLVPSAYPGIYVKYSNLPKDKEAFINSLTLDPYGDPVENFSTLKEVQKSCSARLVYDVKGTGLDGRERFDVTHSLKGDILNYVAKFFSGENIIKGIKKEGVDGEINHNITISAHLDPCLQIVRTKSSKERGEFFYSKDGKEWSSELLADGHYLKYELSSPDSSDVVMDKKEELTLSIQTRLSSQCDDITSTFKAEYKIGEDKKEISRSVHRKVASNSSSSSSRPVNTAQTGDDAADIRYCQMILQGEPVLDENGRYVKCDTSGKSSSSSSRPANTFNGGSGSSSRPVNTAQTGDDAADIRYCQMVLQGEPVLDENGRYVKCDTSGKSSSSSNPDTVKIKKVLNVIKERPLDIHGYFTHYGDGAYDWLYISRSKKVYKLEGMDENGYLEWLDLNLYIKKVEMNNDKSKVTISMKSTGAYNGLTRALDPDTVKIKKVLNVIKERPLNIHGYFTHYGDGAYDWLYITANRKVVAKLEGMDENGYLEWLKLSKYVEVEMDEDKTSVKIKEKNN